MQFWSLLTFNANKAEQSMAVPLRDVRRKTGFKISACCNTLLYFTKSKWEFRTFGFFTAARCQGTDRLSLAVSQSTV